MIHVTDSPTEGDREAILQGLSVFNAMATGRQDDHRPFAALVKDEAGRTLGGATGASYYGWLFISLLHLPAGMRRRGLGRQVMAAAEAEARARGCVGIRLDTFSFQAPGFYEKLGFARIGTLADDPPGHARHFYAKTLGDS